ncbi:putative erythromycin esterase [Hypomontagnella monticulosa]|nr:putative erythromycin esterase [Hypomontagnella monticulosa]
MPATLSDTLRSAAQQLPPIESDDFGARFDSFGNSRLVLIGDGSHGTSEFYRARAAITRRLIEKHGFTHVAIECDWPDARSIDHYVRQHPRRSKDVPTRVFNHFPRWMWRNEEVQEFVDWLREHNAGLPMSQRTSFNGLDIYSMGASTRAVIEYLDRVDPTLAIAARKRYGCLEPWLDDPHEYGRKSFYEGSAKCEVGVIKMLQQLLANRIELASHPENGEAFTDAEMNARVVRDSERYYRAMFHGDKTAWNIRDTHMFSTLSRLLKLKPGSKAVVWAHNSHIGDARGSSWDEPMRVMDVLPSRPDSYERAFHDTGIPAFVVDLRGMRTEPMLQRFIGVVYRPDTERWSHYIKTNLADQYDAFVWFDETKAVNAFETAQPKEAISKGETYPFGV